MRLLANKAGLKSMILNRIGDFGLLLGVVMIYYFFGSTEYSIVFALSHYMNSMMFNFLNFHVSVISFIAILLFLGAMGKSAQFGLHS
jgi:NADH-quinone oxidoreductase subunit L